MRRDDDVQREALQYEVASKRKRGRPKRMWGRQVKEEVAIIGLKKEDTYGRTRRYEGNGYEVNLAISVHGDHVR